MPLSPAFFPAPADALRDPTTEGTDPTTSEAAQSLFADLPGSLLAMIGVLAVLGLLTTNGLLTAASLLVLGVAIVLLWRPGEPPVLLFAVGYQWAQVTAKVFHADLFGVPIEAISASQASIRLATWLSLLGLVVLAAGMRLGLRKLPIQGKRLGIGAADFSISRAFWLYAGAAVVSTVVLAFAWSIGSLTQILLGLADLKWAAFFVLAYLVFQRREGFLFLAVAFGIELVQGVGFFSDFKTVFFVTLLAAFATRVRLTFGTVLGGTAVLALLLVMGAAWTVVKPEFRSAISEGAGAQNTAESQGEMVSRLGGMLLSLTGRDLKEGLHPFLQRVAYTDFFALAIDYVPAYRPYGRGELWGTAVKHVLQPRLLFPDKPRLLSDSEVTMAWTGQFLASDAEGTSISIGYMGEAYADFGRVGMFGVVLIIGIAWGLIYAYFVRRANVPLIGLSFALTILLSAYVFEVASIKLVGGVGMKFIVAALLYRFVEPRVAAWLQGGVPEGEAAVATGTDYVAQAGAR